MPPVSWNTCCGGKVFQKKKDLIISNSILCWILAFALLGSTRAANPFGSSTLSSSLSTTTTRTFRLVPSLWQRSNDKQQERKRFPWETQPQRYYNNINNNDNNNNIIMKANPTCADTQTCLADQMRGGHIAEHASTITDTPYGLPLNVWKVLFQALLTAINVACWLIPLRSKQVVDNALALSLANAFSGGVFLALAFGHLIPECLHGFPADWNETAPFYLVLAGYLVIFFVEKVAFDAHDILHEMQAGGGSTAVADHHHHHHHRHAHTSHGTETNHINNKATTNGNTDATTSTIASPPPPPSTGRSAIILLGALGVHSILEMMALGLSDTFRDGALLTASIALHQPAESIALLVAFLKSGLTHNEIVTYLSVFSCMGPIGVALGMAVNEYAAPVVDAAMLAVVAGTFVYVGATEVIPEEWEDSKHKWKKFAALMTGIVSIAGITQYTMSLGDGHDHGSHAHG